jgi:hypothetical protein
MIKDKFEPNALREHIAELSHRGLITASEKMTPKTKITHPSDDSVGAIQLEC